MHLRCMTEYVRRNQMPASLSLGFLLLLFPAHTRKSCRLRVSRTSCVLIFSYVNLSPYLITFGDGLRLHHASAMHDRIRSEKPNASFAVAWFSLTPFPCPYSKILPLTRQPHFVRSDFLLREPQPILNHLR